MPEATAHALTTQVRCLAAVPGTDEFLTLFLWFAAAAFVAVGGLYVAMAIRKWSQREEPVETFTIQDLRDMRACGQITDQEFAVMRAALISGLQAEPPAGSSSLAEASSGPAPDGDDGPPPDDPTPGL